MSQSESQLEQDKLEYLEQFSQALQRIIIFIQANIDEGESPEHLMDELRTRPYMHGGLMGTNKIFDELLKTCRENPDIQPELVEIIESVSKEFMDGHRKRFEPGTDFEGYLGVLEHFFGRIDEELKWLRNDLGKRSTFRGTVEPVMEGLKASLARVKKTIELQELARDLNTFCTIGLCEVTDRRACLKDLIGILGTLKNDGDEQLSEVFTKILEISEFLKRTHKNLGAESEFGNIAWGCPAIECISYRVTCLRQAEFDIFYNAIKTVNPKGSYSAVMETFFDKLHTMREASGIKGYTKEFDTIFNMIKGHSFSFVGYSKSKSGQFKESVQNFKRAWRAYTEAGRLEEAGICLEMAQEIKSSEGIDVTLPGGAEVQEPATA